MAPPASARVLASRSTSAVRARTGRKSAGAIFFDTVASTPKPSRRGMCRSSRMMSGWASSMALSALTPSAKRRIFAKPAVPRMSSSRRRLASLSSTTKIDMRRSSAFTTAPTGRPSERSSIASRSGRPAVARLNPPGPGNTDADLAGNPFGCGPLLGVDEEADRLPWILPGAKDHATVAVLRRRELNVADLTVRPRPNPVTWPEVGPVPDDDGVRPGDGERPPDARDVIDDLLAKTRLCENGGFEITAGRSRRRPIAHRLTPNDTWTIDPNAGGSIRSIPTPTVPQDDRGQN